MSDAQPPSPARGPGGFSVDRPPRPRPPFPARSQMESALRFTRFIPLGLSLLLAVGAGFALPARWAVILLLAGAGLTLIGFYDRSEEHTSELQSLMRLSYAVFCLKKKKKKN